MADEAKETTPLPERPSSDTPKKSTSSKATKREFTVSFTRGGSVIKKTVEASTAKEALALAKEAK